MHEQSETIERGGRWFNVYGKDTPKAGMALPGEPSYGSSEEAVAAARARSAKEPPDPPRKVSMNDIYRDGFMLQRAIEAGDVTEDQVSDKGRLSLALIRRQVKPADLTRQGREILGIPIPFTERAWDFAKDQAEKATRAVRAGAQAGGETLIEGVRTVNPFGRGTEGPVDAIGRTVRGAMEIGGALPAATRGFAQSLASEGGEVMTRRPTVGGREIPSAAEMIGAVGEAAGFMVPEAIPKTPRARTREVLSFEEWQQRYPGTERQLRPELRPDVNPTKLTGQETLTGGSAGAEAFRRPRAALNAGPRPFAPGDTPSAEGPSGFDILNRSRRTREQLPPAPERPAVGGRVSENPNVIDADYTVTTGTPTHEATPVDGFTILERTRALPTRQQGAVTGRVAGQTRALAGEVGVGAEGEGGAMVVGREQTPAATPPTYAGWLQQRIEDLPARPVEFRPGETTRPQQPPPTQDTAARPVEPPRFERTEIGDQGVIPGAGGRTVPDTKTTSTAPQRPVEDTPLLGQEREARARELEGAQGDIDFSIRTQGRGAGDAASVDTRDPESLGRYIRSEGGLAGREIEGVPLHLRNNKGRGLDEIAQQIADAQGRSAREVEREITHTLQRYRLEKGGRARQAASLEAEEAAMWERYQEELAKAEREQAEGGARREPPPQVTRPEGVSEAEWNAMPPAQQRAVWSLFNDFGRIPPSLAARLGLSAFGGVAGFTQGENTSERVKNAALGAAAGFMAPTALRGLRAAMERAGVPDNEVGAIGRRPPEVPRHLRREAVTGGAESGSEAVAASTTPPAATSTAASAGVAPVGAVARGWEYLTLPAISVWERMGDAGVKLSKVVQNKWSSEMRWIGQHGEPLLRAAKRLTAAEKENLRAVMEDGAAPMNDKVAQVHQMTERVFGERGAIPQGARQRGVVVLGPDETVREFTPRKSFFPHEFTPEVRRELTTQGSSRRERAINHLVETGQAHDRETAGVMLDERFGSKTTTIGDRVYILDPDRYVGGLERTRELNLPDYIKDPVAAFTIRLSKVARRFAELDHYGQLDRNVGSPGGYIDPMTGEKVPAHGLIGEIQRTQGYERAQQAHALFVESLGHRPDVSRVMQEAANKVTAVEAVTKLGLAAIANATQFALVGVRTGIMPMLRGLASSATRAGREAAQELGVLSDMSLRELYRDVGAPEGGASTGVARKVADVSLKPFNVVERWDRTVGANAGRAWGDVLEGRLRETKHRGFMDRELDRLNFSREEIADIRERGRFTQEERDRIAWAITDQTQFLGRAYRRSQFFNTPAGQVIGQFKSFAINQGRLMREMLWDEARRGNLKPLATFAVLFPIVGEAAQDVKALARGSERPDSLVARVIENVAAVGGFGLATDFLQSLQYGEHGFASFLGGPALSDATQVITRSYRTGQAAFEGDVEKMTKRLQSMLEYGVRQVPVVGPRAAQELKQGPNAERRRELSPMGRLGLDPDERALKNAERTNRDHSRTQKRVNELFGAGRNDEAWALADEWNAAHPNAQIRPRARRQFSEPGSREHRIERLRPPYREGVTP